MFLRSTGSAGAKPWADRLVTPAKTSVRWGLGHALPRVMINVGARRGDLQGRLILSDGEGTDIDALFDEIRAQGALAKTRLGYITTSHASVREVLSSPDFQTGIFARDDSPLGRLLTWASIDQLHPVEPPSLLAVDPPDHTRYRKLVTRVFTMRAVERLRDRTQQIADELLDSLDPSSPLDLVDAYCAQLPVTVICEILGVPASDRDKVLAFGGGAAPSLDVGLPWRTFRSVERSLGAFDAWLTDHFARLRESPGDDLLSQLVQASDDGQQLTDRELKSTAGLVLAAGFETTVNLLGNGVALLAAHPDQRAALVADPELWPTAVDEVLRYDPPVLLTGRLASRRTDVRGRPVPAGALVTTVIAGANRDPEVFTDPARFDVARANAREHLSFGAGRHHCLGATLARMEGEVGLRTITERFPDLQVLPGARRRETRILRGYSRLPVRLQPTDAAAGVTSSG